jgi:hypothetical protein
LFKERQAKAVLVFEEKIVHLPEFALGAGEFGGFSGGLGVRMALRQRKIAEDKEQALAEVLLDALDDGIGAAAVRALVISILHERDRREGIALSVIFRADGSFELGHGGS